MSTDPWYAISNDLFMSLGRHSFVGSDWKRGIDDASSHRARSRTFKSESYGSHLPEIFDLRILQGYKRYCVKGAAYPGILPSHGSSVQGFLASIPASHLTVLDVFEGSDYGQRCVQIETNQGRSVQALVYEWIGDQSLLEDREWDFRSFVSHKEQEWIRSGDDYFAAASRITSSQ